MKESTGKNIESLTMTKTFVVKLNKDTTSEHDIDMDVFDNPYIEAATRSIEKVKKKRYAPINQVVECWEKKNPEKSYYINSYFVLLNASCHSKAELLREKFRIQKDKDLASLPRYGIKKL